VEESFGGWCWNLWTGPMSSSLRMISFPDWSGNWDWSDLGSIGKHRNLNIFWSWKFLEVDRSMIFRIIRFSWILIDFSELTPDSLKILQPPVHRIDWGCPMILAFRSQLRWRRNGTNFIRKSTSICPFLRTIAFITSVHPNQWLPVIDWFISRRSHKFILWSQEIFGVSARLFQYLPRWILSNFYDHCDANTFLKSFHFLKCSSIEIIAV
jgi:hypothetical protein